MIKIQSREYSTCFSYGMAGKCGPECPDYGTPGCDCDAEEDSGLVEEE